MPKPSYHRIRRATAVNVAVLQRYKLYCCPEGEVPVDYGRSPNVTEYDPGEHWQRIAERGWPPLADDDVPKAKAEYALSIFGATFALHDVSRRQPTWFVREEPSWQDCAPWLVCADYVEERYQFDATPVRGLPAGIVLPIIAKRIREALAKRLPHQLRKISLTGVKLFTRPSYSARDAGHLDTERYQEWLARHPVYDWKFLLALMGEVGLPYPVFAFRTKTATTEHGYTKFQAASAIVTAFDWHGGGGSPFYAFASTRTVQSEDHRSRILDEAATCLRMGQKRFATALQALVRVVHQAPVGVEIVDDTYATQVANRRRT